MTTQGCTARVGKPLGAAPLPGAVPLLQAVFWWARLQPLAPRPQPCSLTSHPKPRWLLWADSFPQWAPGGLTQQRPWALGYLQPPPGPHRIQMPKSETEPKPLSWEPSLLLGAWREGPPGGHPLTNMHKAQRPQADPGMAEWGFLAQP